MDEGAVHYIGKIDKTIFQCVAAEILTDEVVITEKQIQHIFCSHTEYEHRWILQDLHMVVTDPDYILQDTHETHRHDTAIVLKHIKRSDGGYRIILRLVTSREDAERKNCIITASYISDKKWRKYLRNKIILYKKP